VVVVVVVVVVEADPVAVVGVELAEEEEEFPKPPEVVFSIVFVELRSRTVFDEEFDDGCWKLLEVVEPESLVTFGSELELVKPTELELAEPTEVEMAEPTESVAASFAGDVFWVVSETSRFGAEYFWENAFFILQILKFHTPAVDSPIILATVVGELFSAPDAESELSSAAWVVIPSFLAFVLVSCFLVRTCLQELI